MILEKMTTICMCVCVCEYVYKRLKTYDSSAIKFSLACSWFASSSCCSSTNIFSKRRCSCRSISRATPSSNRFLYDEGGGGGRGGEGKQRPPNMSNVKAVFYIAAVIAHLLLTLMPSDHSEYMRRWQLWRQPSHKM